MTTPPPNEDAEQLPHRTPGAHLSGYLTVMRGHLDQHSASGYARDEDTLGRVLDGLNQL